MVTSISFNKINIQILTHFNLIFNDKEGFYVLNFMFIQYDVKGSLRKEPFAMPTYHFPENTHNEASQKEIPRKDIKDISHNAISVDQKLELIRQVRSQYRQNQNDLMHRESILYDRPIRPAANSEENPATNAAYHEADYGSINYNSYNSYNTQKKGSQTDGTLKIRFILAVALTALVILFHQTSATPVGINMEQVFLTLEQDYEDIILSWSSTLIHTTPLPNGD